MLHKLTRMSVVNNEEREPILNQRQVKEKKKPTLKTLQNPSYATVYAYSVTDVRFNEISNLAKKKPITATIF